MQGSAFPRCAGLPGLRPARARARRFTGSTRGTWRWARQSSVPASQFARERIFPQGPCRPSQHGAAGGPGEAAGSLGMAPSPTTALARHPPGRAWLAPAQARRGWGALGVSLGERPLREAPAAARKHRVLVAGGAAWLLHPPSQAPAVCLHRQAEDSCCLRWTSCSGEGAGRVPLWRRHQVT